MPAVQNELVYIIRLTPEGEQEVVRANRVIDQTGKSVDKVDKSFGSFKNTLGATGKKTAQYSKQSAGASNALLDLTRIAQDAQYGIRGVANNLEQAAVSSGNAFKSFGSFRGLMGGLGTALTGPVGVVVGITAVTQVLQLAERGVFSFGEEVKDFAADSEEMISKLQDINDELNELKGFTSDSFFSTAADKASLDRLQSYKKELKSFLSDVDKASEKLIDKPFFRAQVNTSTVDELVKQYDITERYATLLKRVEGELEDRSKGKPFLPETAFKQSSVFLENVEGQIDEIQQKIDRTSFIGGFDTSAANEESRKALEATKTMQELRTDLAKETNTALENLEAERVEKVKEIREDENLDAAQQKEAIALIDENYAKRATEIRKEEAEKQAQITEQRVADQKEAEAFLAKQQLQIAQTAGNEQKALELEKQQAIADIKDRFAADDKRRKEALDNLDEIYANKAAARIEAQQQKEARAEAKKLEERRKARDAFERQQLDLEAASLSPKNEEFVNLYNETQDELDNVRSLYDQRVISKREMEEAITLIEQQYSDKRKDIVQAEAARKKEIEERNAQIRRAAQLETLVAFTGQLQASFEDSKAVAVATGTVNAILAGINTRKTVAEFAPPPFPTIAGAAMAALQLREVAKIRSTSLSGSGSASSSGGSIGYRGFDFGSDRVREPGADRTRAGRPDTGNTNSGAGGRETRYLKITNGFDKIVGEGQEIIDRKGGSNYLRGNGNG